MIPDSKRYIDKFWDRVYKMGDDGCWWWLAGQHELGYGRFTHYDKKGKKYQQSAHRVAYELCVGQIPKRLQIDHLCKNPSCVRPDHLEVVTPQENSSRRSRAITYCAKGHKLDEKNTRTYIGRYGYPWRRCKKCDELYRRSRGIKPAPEHKA